MSRRPLAALASVVLTVLGVLFLFPPDCASACTCELVGGQCQKEIVEGAISDSEAVFSGEVVAVERGTSTLYDTVTLRASEVWDGARDHGGGRVQALREPLRAGVRVPGLRLRKAGPPGRYLHRDQAALEGRRGPRGARGR